MEQTQLNQPQAAATPQAQPNIVIQTPTQPKNRSALWAIIGVFTGFLLPVFACIGLTVSTLVGLAASGGNASTTPNLGNATLVPQHVSGPLTGPAVALIDVNGAITRGGTDSPFATDTNAVSTRIVPAIKAAAKNPDVKVILLRVDSPGGSVVASDEIYRALKASGKPIVAVMGETAASGGVYVSMAADYIVAHPDSFTGSIGVILSLTNLQELYEKIGVKNNIIKSGKFKDIGNAGRELTDDERVLLQTIIDEAYANFVDLVAKGRKMSVDDVKKFADGRIMTGRQAKAVGLVDELGLEEDALNKAASLASISGTPRVIIYKSQRPIDTLLGGLANQMLSSWFGISVNQLSNAAPRLEFR